ncbi:MAG: DUF4333 domain-containing protein, partial [Thermocrispum sp.]
MIRRLLAAGLLLAGVAACGTGSERVIAPEELARGVSAALQQAGRQHTQVSCTEGVKAQVAESTSCTMSVAGERFEVTVIVTGVQG